MLLQASLKQNNQDKNSVVLEIFAGIVKMQIYI